MPRAKIIVTPKPKRKSDRKLRKQLRELEKFKPKKLTTEKPKRLIPIEEYVPTADIFEIIEDAIYSKIPNETMVWKKGHKGGIPVDLTSLKQQAIFLIRDYAVSDDTGVIDYFQKNENAIVESAESFTYASQSDGFNMLVDRFLNLINMGNALSTEAMYYNEVSEILDVY